MVRNVNKMLNNDFCGRNKKIDRKLHSKKKHMTIKHLTSMVLILTIGIQVQSQTYDDYFKKLDDEFAQYAKQQDLVLAKYAEMMDQRLAELDKQWAEYLKQRFIEFETYTQKRPATGPKPGVTPRFNVAKNTKTTHHEIEAKPSHREKESTWLTAPPLQKQTPADVKIETTKFNFYGTPVKISYPEGIAKPFTQKSITENAISEHFTTLSNTPYSIVINSLLEAKNEINLNDYALYMLIKQATKVIAKDSESAVFLQWFLMMKLGYRVKIGYKDTNLYMLIPSIDNIYERPFLTIDNVKYYMIEGASSKISTYDKDFSEAQQMVSMEIRSAINLQENKAIRTLTFTHNQQKHKLAIEYNKNLIDFYKHYPLCDIRIYFDAAVSSLTKLSMAQQIGELIKNLDEKESSLLLLKFVQTAFEYQTDHEQFQSEKFFFTEELFGYPYSDCEDRSVLFAHLIRKFLNLEVIGVSYKGHMATAVKFNTPVEGDYIMKGADKYVICDPTYVNAPIGLTMPQYAAQKATLIELSQQHNTNDLHQQIWRHAMKNGCFRSNNRKDAITDNDGNTYITGYYTGTIKFNNNEYQSADNSRDMFIARYNNKNQPEWIQTYGGKGNESGYSIEIGHKGEIYVALSFNESFTFDYKYLKAKNTGDVAVAQFTPTGKLEWVTQIGIEQTQLTKPFIFVAQLSTQGKVQPLTIYHQVEDYQDFGLQISPEGSPYLSGANYLTTELKTAQKTYNSEAEFTPADLILAENVKLQSDNFHPSVAGLFAALKLINNNTISLNGTELQKTLDKNNPNFRTTTPTVYEGLGTIQFIRNSDGLIVVKTTDNNEVGLQTIKIHNNAKFKVSSFSSGNHQIDILNGMDVGKSIIWYNLNSLKIMKNGDMIVDYDSDHTKIRMNIEKDILQ